jgi:hypothetical protein
MSRARHQAFGLFGPSEEIQPQCGPFERPSGNPLENRSPDLFVVGHRDDEGVRGAEIRFRLGLRRLVRHGLTLRIPNGGRVRVTSTQQI